MERFPINNSGIFRRRAAIFALGLLFFCGPVLAGAGSDVQRDFIVRKVPGGGLLGLRFISTKYDISIL